MLPTGNTIEFFVEKSWIWTGTESDVFDKIAPILIVHDYSSTKSVFIDYYASVDVIRSIIDLDPDEKIECKKIS